MNCWHIWCFCCIMAGPGWARRGNCHSLLWKHHWFIHLTFHTVFWINMFLSYFYYWECILGVLFGAPGFCLAYLVFCLAYLIFVCCTWYFVWRTWCYLFLTWWFAWHTINSWHTWCVVWCNWYFFGVLHHNIFADLCLYSLNKLWWKQSLSRSLWKKVRRLEKGTPPPVVAVVTNMRYGSNQWCSHHGL